MQEAEVERISPIGVPSGYEQEAIDIARRALCDIPECRDAEYSVFWADGALPILRVVFQPVHFMIAGRPMVASPAVGVALMSVRKGTLHDIMPGKTLLAGERLRDRVLFSVTDYLENHGIRVVLPETLLS